MPRYNTAGIIIYKKLLGDKPTKFSQVNGINRQNTIHRIFSFKRKIMLLYPKRYSRNRNSLYTSFLFIHRPCDSLKSRDLRPRVLTSLSDKKPIVLVAKIEFLSAISKSPVPVRMETVKTRLPLAGSFVVLINLQCFSETLETFSGTLRMMENVSQTMERYTAMGNKCLPETNKLLYRTKR